MIHSFLPHEKRSMYRGKRNKVFHLQCFKTVVKKCKHSAFSCFSKSLVQHTTKVKIQIINNSVKSSSHNIRNPFLPHKNEQDLLNEIHRLQQFWTAQKVNFLCLNYKLFLVDDLRKQCLCQKYKNSRHSKMNIEQHVQKPVF